MSMLRERSRALPSLLFGNRCVLRFDQLPFVFDHLSARKRANLLLAGVQEALRLPFRLARPVVIQIEPINTCNLSCPTCIAGGGLATRAATPMPYERFCRVIDQVKSHALILLFWSWGEPFLHPDACRMIRYARQAGLRVHTSTNGHFLDTAERAAAVVDSGLDSLVFAVDGLDPDTYALYRRGGDLPTVLRSIRAVLAARKAAGGPGPLVTLRFIVMRHNEHQVARLESFARELGVDAFTLRSAVVQRGPVDLESTLGPQEDGYRRRSGGAPAGCLPPPVLERMCHRPYVHLTVFSNGDVVLCEHDFSAGAALGNVGEQSIRGILGSAAARAARRRFRATSAPYPFCATCEFRDSRHETLNIETRVLRAGQRVA